MWHLIWKFRFYHFLPTIMNSKKTKNSIYAWKKTLAQGQRKTLQCKVANSKYQDSCCIKIGTFRRRWKVFLFFKKILLKFKKVHMVTKRPVQMRQFYRRRVLLLKRCQLFGVSCQRKNANTWRNWSIKKKRKLSVVNY